nr:hypothetical protein [uncultured Actinomyces sp.]
MNTGRLIRIDALAELWADPDSREVAEFLGFGPVLAAEDLAALGWAALLGRAGGGAGDGGAPGAGARGRSGADGSRQRPAAASITAAAVSAGAPLLTATGRVTALHLRRGERQAEVLLDLPSGMTAVRALAEGAGLRVGREVALSLDASRTVPVRSAVSTGPRP